MSVILKGHSDGITAVALSAGAGRALFGSRDNTVLVWDLAGSAPPRILKGHSDGITAVVLSAGGSRALSGSLDDTVLVWDLEGSAPPRILKDQCDRVTAVALGADGRRALSESHDHTVRVWNWENGRCMAVFTCDRDISCVAWARDRIPVGDDGGHVHLFR